MKLLSSLDSINFSLTHDKLTAPAMPLACLSVMALKKNSIIRRSPICTSAVTAMPGIKFTVLPST
jgi:hypothetical protein